MKVLDEIKTNTIHFNWYLFVSCYLLSETKCPLNKRKEQFAIYLQEPAMPGKGFV